MTTRTSFGAALALAAAGAVLVSAAPQQPPAQTQARPAQTFQAQTLVIEVDAIVTDGKGRFVDDLTPGDFEILDQGKPQTVQTLYRVEGKTVTPIAPMAAPPVAAPAASPAFAPPRADRRVYVFFFDEPHLTQGAYHRLQRAAEDYLQSEFQPGDVGGVLIGEKMVGSRLTTDRDQLIAAVKSSKLSPEATSLARDLQDWPRMSAVEAIRIAVNNDNDVLNQVADRAAREGPTGGRQSPDMTPEIMQKARMVVSQLNESTRKTLTTLAVLANGLDRVPGRKTIVFMSEGFYTQNAEEVLRQIVGIAARSNVRIYAIDARGLNRGTDGSDLSVMNPMETGAAIPTDLYNTIEDAPNTLAVDTGGYVVRNTNAFKDALAQIEADASHYYVLGYSPTNTTMDGKFRQITVKVKRPGLTVRARRGYLALPPGAAAPPLELKANESAPTAKGAPSTAQIALAPQTQAHIRAFAASQPKSGAAQKLADEGWVRYTKGDLAGASARLAEAAAEPSAAPWITYALGYAQFGQGQTKQAVASWEKVRAAAPDFQGVYMDLANGYLALNDPVHAISVLRTAERRWPKDVKVLNAIGTMQVRQQVLDDAIATFEKAIDADPKDPTAYLNVARTYELRYYKMRRYSRPGGAQAANPDDAKKAIENYEAYLKHGGPDEADAKAAIERLKDATKK